MSSDHEWRNCFHPTTQQGGDGCHFFMRCHGVWPTLCELPERDHAERDDEQIKRLTAEVERLTRERDEAQDAALGYARALRNVLDMAYRRAHKQIIAHVMAVLGGAADDPASGERDALAAQVAALREALAYYAEPRQYNRAGGDPADAAPFIQSDRGRRARAALAAAGVEGQG